LAKLKTRCNAFYFGDIFLEDLRKYREDKLAEIGFEGIFRYGKYQLTNSFQEFISLDLKRLWFVSTNDFRSKLCWSVIDQDFINDLPENVDVCGENGEFHTFTFDGPIFSKPIAFEIGEVVYRKYENPRKKTPQIPLAILVQLML
jgi:diphthamide synthase (EF-2-diphthine--ammonia ligase)